MSCCAGYDWCASEPTVHSITTEDGKKDYCLYHAPQCDAKCDQEKFNQLIYDKINTALKNKVKCDLSGTIFPWDIRFQFDNKKQTLPEISFFHSKFEGEATFKLIRFSGTADFSGVEFQKDAAFFDVDFEGEAVFGKTESPTGFPGEDGTDISEFFFDDAVLFKENVSFDNTNFHDNAYFMYAESKVMTLAKTTFHKNIDLKDSTNSDVLFILNSTFEGMTNFYRSKLSTAYLDGSTFKGPSNFRELIIKNNTKFLNSAFEGSVDFTQARLNITSSINTTFFEDVFFDSCVFKSATFYNETFMKRVYLRGLYIEESITFQNTNLRNASFMETNLRKCDFVNSNWREKNGRFILYDEVELCERIRNYFNNSPIKYLPKMLSPVLTISSFFINELYPLYPKATKIIESLYRALKQQSREKHNELYVSMWHYSEKEMLRMSTGLATRRGFFYSIILNLYKLISGYGEDPLRAGIVLAIIAFIAAFCLGSLGLIPTETYPPSTDQAVYLFSLETEDLKRIFITTIEFLTFQKSTYFNLEPSNVLGVIIKIFFQILVPIQTALFAFALRNRLRR